METAVKLPLLRLGALSGAPRRGNNDEGDRECDDDVGLLPPLTSPSRAVLLLFDSAPSSSTQSLAMLKRQHSRQLRKPRERQRQLQPEDFAKSPLELATEQLRASRVSKQASLLLIQLVAIPTT